MGPLLESAQMLAGERYDRAKRIRRSALTFSAALRSAAIAICLVFIWPVIDSPATAHPGGLASDGCHNDRKNGGRHCHRDTNASKTVRQTRDGHVHYPNCAAARRAGVTPIYRGQPGYGSHLDRDGDGKACE